MQFSTPLRQVTHYSSLKHRIGACQGLCRKRPIASPVADASLDYEGAERNGYFSFLSALFRSSLPKSVDN